MFLSGQVAMATGTLYVFVFKNGIPQNNVSIHVGNYEKLTDEYGLANFELEPEHYEISYSKAGQLFWFTEINLVGDQQSQVFLQLTKKGADVDLDLPLAAYDRNFEQHDIKEQVGPKGTLQLRLLDSKNKKPVVGAKLYFRGYAVEASSDAHGIAKIGLSEGNYDISLIHPKYVMRVLKDVKIKADEVTEKTEPLVRSDIVMQEYVVTAPAVEGSLASTFEALKESSVIGERLSNEEFSKSGDASAADALKRVTGITIVNDKYVYVRGLGERYSMVTLNGLHLPSTEPTKRAVPLDIFPSSVIQSMSIQKTYSVDLPGNFAGGDVLISSKDIPKEDNYAKLSIGTEYTSYTGKDVYANSDNSKGLPQNIIDKSASFTELTQFGAGGYSLEELHTINSQIVNYRHYNLDRTTLKPGTKIAIDLGQSFRTSGGLRYGVAGTVYSSKTGKLTKGTAYGTEYKSESDSLKILNKTDVEQSELGDKKGGLLSLALEGRNGSKLKYTYLNVIDRVDDTTYKHSQPDLTGPGQGDENRTFYEYKVKTITAHQIRGDHKFYFDSFKSDLINDVDISWALEKAKATRLVPGSVEYFYEKIFDTTPYTLNKEIWFRYSDLEDTVDNNRIDITLPYKNHLRDNYTSLGLFDYHKSRSLDNRRFLAQHALGDQVYGDIDSVFTQQNVDNGDLAFTSNYQPDDSYTAKQDVSAIYIKQLYSFSKNLELLAGVRKEHSKQQLIKSDTGVPYSPLVTDDTLKSISINYSINDENKIRFGYANTLSRPDFREFSPNRSVDPITEDTEKGEPSLKKTGIQNLDIKYERYISYDEIFTVGVFLKDFSNPVEKIAIPDPGSQSGKKMVVPRNALAARSKGFEMSIRKKLGGLGASLSNYFVASNIALIKSNISLDKNSSDYYIVNLTSADRPMQGQSPYVFNFNIGYDNLNTGRSAIFFYNVFGKRIVALGEGGEPDTYEYPFRKLDFVVKWRLNDIYDEQVKKIGYSLDMKLKNILGSKAEIREGDVITAIEEPGRALSLSFSISY